MTSGSITSASGGTTFAGRIPHDLAQKAERQAEILRDAGRVTGIASGDDIAHALRIPVEDVEGLPRKVRCTVDWAACKVLVDSELPPAPKQFSICYGLSEYHQINRLPHILHQAFCNRSAAAQLMPRCTFVRTLFAHGFDLSSLRLRWVHCSFEAVARRAPEVWPGLVASAWRGAEARWHRESEGLVIPTHLVRLELSALGEAYKSGRSMVHIEKDGWLIHALRTTTLPNTAVIVSEKREDSPLRQRHWIEEPEWSQEDSHSFDIATNKAGADEIYEM